MAGEREKEDDMRTRLFLLRTAVLSSWRRLAGQPFLMVAAAILGATAVLAQQPGKPPNASRNRLSAPVNAQESSTSLSGVGNTTDGPDATNRGGAANADFDSLIDLIISTIETDTWAENGGGEADIRPFPGGVLVDAAGTLRLKSRPAQLANVQQRLTALRGAAPRSNSLSAADARRPSTLRYVSLPRLEREIARRQADRKPLDPTMLTLAGLQRVRYIFVYPESGDLVLAGPAGNWQIDADGRILSADTGEAVVRLDDLLVLWRRGNDAADSHFGCSINPRQESLAKTQAFLASTSQRPLQPGQRKRWLGTLRDTVGLQDIEVFGVDPASRVAGVLIEADYHMKLIGMGLADGVAGVESYLASIRLAAGESPPPMSVLRWWFTLNYDAINASPAEDAFELVGQGVRVLSENELLAEQGQRVHTGQSEPLNRQFAEQFTAHFNQLAAKYPVYSELRNIFDLAIAVALIQTNSLVEKVGWEPALLSSAEQLRLPQSVVPRQVETVINHRVINRRHIVAGVSGGVMVAPGDLIKGADAVTGDSQLAESKRTAPSDDATTGTWWWDATN
jgi:hypothetical protein